MRLTSREKEILEVLKKDPMASQEELAERFSITRSSVAVHISNLMKKGVILGKGYVFNEQVTIVVLGEIYQKIQIESEIHPDVINVMFSGSGYEMSKLFARYGMNIKTVSIVGNDDLADMVLSELQETGVDTNNIIRLSNYRTCRRVLVNNQVMYGEELSFNEYRKAIELKEGVVFNCEWLVVEPGFQELIHHKSINKAEDKLPNFSTYFYPRYPEPIPDYLQRFSVIVIGVEDTPDSLDYYVKQSQEMQNREQLYVITDGRDRLVYISNEGSNDFPLLMGQSLGGIKGLSRLSAGIVYGLSCNYPIRQAIRLGIGAI
ncbi:MAG: PfkB family carbohydrate kinase [Syntrophomonadaceae bacterium]|nr:PfkB family carbohydrate kinase [Syntrophomonadaceae bacterium]